MKRRWFIGMVALLISGQMRAAENSAAEVSLHDTMELVNTSDSLFVKTEDENGDQQTEVVSSLWIDYSPWIKKQCLEITLIKKQCLEKTLAGTIKHPLTVPLDVSQVRRLDRYIIQMADDTQSLHDEIFSKESWKDLITGYKDSSKLGMDTLSEHLQEAIINRFRDDEFLENFVESLTFLDEQDLPRELKEAIAASLLSNEDQQILRTHLFVDLQSHLKPRCCALSPLSSFLAVGGKSKFGGGYVEVWDIKRSSLMMRTETSEPVREVHFFDGLQVLVVTDSELALHNCATQEITQLIDVAEDLLWGVHLSADNRALFFGHDKFVEKIDLSSHQMIQYVLKQSPSVRAHAKILRVDTSDPLSDPFVVVLLDTGEITFFKEPDRTMLSREKVHNSFISHWYAHGDRLTTILHDGEVCEWNLSYRAQQRFRRETSMSDNAHYFVERGCLTDAIPGKPIAFYVKRLVPVQGFLDENCIPEEALEYDNTDKFRAYGSSVGSTFLPVPDVPKKFLLSHDGSFLVCLFKDSSKVRVYHYYNKTIKSLLSSKLAIYQVICLQLLANYLRNKMSTGCVNENFFWKSHIKSIYQTFPENFRNILYLVFPEFRRAFKSSFFTAQLPLFSLDSGGEQVSSKSGDKSDTRASTSVESDSSCDIDDSSASTLSLNVSQKMIKPAGTSLPASKLRKPLENRPVLSEQIQQSRWASGKRRSSTLSGPLIMNLSKLENDSPGERMSPSRERIFDKGKRRSLSASCVEEMFDRGLQDALYIEERSFGLDDDSVVSHEGASSTAGSRLRGKDDERAHLELDDVWSTFASSVSKSMSDTLVPVPLEQMGSHEGKKRNRVKKKKRMSASDRIKKSTSGRKSTSPRPKKSPLAKGHSDKNIPAIVRALKGSQLSRSYEVSLARRSHEPPASPRDSEEKRADAIRRSRSARMLGMQGYTTELTPRDTTGNETGLITIDKDMFRTLSEQASGSSGSGSPEGSKQSTSSSSRSGVNPENKKSYDQAVEAFCKQKYADAFSGMNVLYEFTDSELLKGCIAWWLAEMYYHGWGTEYNVRKAVELYLLVAEQTHDLKLQFSAFGRLGELYFGGDIIFENKKNVPLYELRSKQEACAQQWLNRALAVACPPWVRAQSSFLLSLMLGKQPDGNRDRIKELHTMVFDTCTEIINQGTRSPHFKYAKLILGQLHMLDTQKYADSKKAFSLFSEVEKSSDLYQQAEARYLLADWYFKENLKLDKARDCLKKVARQNPIVNWSAYARACMRLGNIYTHAQGVARNFEKAAAYYKNAFEQTYSIGIQCEAYYGYARIHQLGGNGIQKDLTCAFDHDTKAARCEHDSKARLKACMNVAKNLYLGKHGGQDFSQACIFYEIIAQESQDSTQLDTAWSCLAQMYKEGKGNVTADKEKAQMYYKLLAQRGQDLALKQKALGEVGAYADDWYVGKNGEQDFSQACIAYEIIARESQDSTQLDIAWLRLALICKEGKGTVIADKAKAQTYYKLLAQHGQDPILKQKALVEVGAYANDRYVGTSCEQDFSQACSFYEIIAQESQDSTQLDTAWSRLALLYKEGKGDVTADKEKAQMYYRLLAQRGQDLALKQKALFEVGTYAYEQKESEALDFLQQAADLDADPEVKQQAQLLLNKGSDALTTASSDE